MKDLLKDFEEIRLTKNAMRALILIAQRGETGPYEFLKRKYVANPKEAYNAFKILEKAKFIKSSRKNIKKYTITPLGFDFLNNHVDLRDLKIEHPKKKPKLWLPSFAFKK